MARPEPNMRSQKWGKGLAGPRELILMVSAASAVPRAGFDPVRPKPATTARASETIGRMALIAPRLETEARLQLDHPSGETSSGSPKVWIRDNCARFEETNRCEIQLVEGVKEVGADFERSAFAKAPDLSESCLFNEAQVDAVELWASE